MKTFKSTIIIAAHKSTVFDAISTPEKFAEAIPKILEVEFLTDLHKGVGTKFRETREMNGKKSSVVLEVTEFKVDEYIRLLSIAGGTTWDSKFTVTHSDGSTQLTLTMDAKPKHILAKMMLGLISKMLKKELDSDLQSVKLHCETN